MTIYIANGTNIERIDREIEIPAQAVWVDLRNPGDTEERKFERLLKTDIPSKAEMSALKMSDRLYQRKKSLYLTVSLVSGIENGARAVLYSTTFILRDHLLITVCNAPDLSLSDFVDRFNKKNDCPVTKDSLLLEMLEYMVHREADLLEHSGKTIENLSEKIFQNDMKTGRDQLILSALLRQVGRQKEFINKLTESLISINRAASYAEQYMTEEWKNDNGTNIKTVTRDLKALAEHAAFLSEKLTFLLDATLGMISIEQNNIVRLLSVVTLVFMPPTLIAGVYGMNFRLIPELDWRFGYPFAVSLMLIAAFLPLILLKIRKKL